MLVAAGPKKTVLTNATTMNPRVTTELAAVAQSPTVRKQLDVLIIETTFRSLSFRAKLCFVLRASSAEVPTVFRDRDGAAPPRGVSRIGREGVLDDDV